MIRIIFLFITIGILSSCDNQNIENRILFLETENFTLKEQNEILLNDLKKCNQIIGEYNLKSNSSKSNSKPNKKIIGKWKTPSLFGGGDLTIEKENGAYFKIERFIDNSFSKNEMILRMDGAKMIFGTKGRNSSDHWVILENGKLEVRDNDGLIYTSESIQ